MDESRETQESPEKSVDSASNGLTGIPHRIHCPATQTSGGRLEDELDRIAVDHFLDTLAEVAISIAARERATTQIEGQDG